MDTTYYTVQGDVLRERIHFLNNTIKKDFTDLDPLTGKSMFFYHLHGTNDDDADDMASSHNAKPGRARAEAVL